ncbi:Putative Zinc finger, PHD-type, Zinc finger, FYVE/PHD-type, Zinc finger, RING/FYVE/PHD-type [Septoria linicola]|uniref:Zinc finger, PHD-type, Zinc finger, FYVE/PHD-type, Zinc finger, RING/FYVE/PHD-type n=1 Tax=Septoria linicola TaxID=215465 RepID=A0A9Q9EGT0_9PEZI|nr:putative Zinc finger, PHD-type, Zinc finger, FYVE/PHD-type, Zinc finger, RING/FYVE/PHD-type [Septoria linicola]USW49157.1 Putative Zinc finger, PHD-type, Zinc finger, FYVE/PHD-type, Zinc finger, RING/FYVE/PHD-type [Septoria linicola]
MDSSLSYLDTTERQTRMNSAQNEVLEWELNGTIVNEHYSKDEYFQRRFNHLGRHPDYRTNLRLAPVARRDADLVYNSQTNAMSVQAIRQVELQHHFCPLLPLPTTANVETADDTLDSYPATEWQPQQAANTPAAMLYPGNSASVNRARAHNYQMEGPVLNPPRSPKTMAQIIRDLNSPLGTRDLPPPQYRAEQGVSAVGNRAIHVPVKTPLKTGEKRRHSQIEAGDGDEQFRGDGSDQANEETSARDSPSPGPAKRLRLQGAPLRNAGADQATGAPTGAPRIKLAAPRKTGAPAPPPINGNLTGVVSGARLPKTIREATDGAVERRQVLERAHLVSNRSARNLDLPPEFFSTYNFTAEEKANIGNDDGPIRCICGEGEVAGKADWIQCDGDDCGVWQHVVCMEDAVQKTEKERQAAKYLCQVCSPWAHRRTIQRLRRQNPNPVARAEAEAGNDEEDGDDEDEDEDDE